MIDALAKELGMDSGSLVGLILRVGGDGFVMSYVREMRSVANAADTRMLTSGTGYAVAIISGPEAEIEKRVRLVENLNEAARKIGFAPDWVVPPGETLKDWFGEIGLDRSIAQKSGISAEVLERVLDGDEPITFELAHRIALMTGISAHFWQAAEHNYRVGLAQGKTRS